MSPDEKPLRLFIAFSVPEDELRRVAEATSPLRQRWPDARWAPLQNQHVTLKFLGSTPPDLANEVAEVVRDVASGRATSDIGVSGFGVFPGPRRARVLWAGLRDHAEVLATTAKDLSTSLAPLGFEPEKRDFTPHLTLARFREPVRVGEDLPNLDEGSPFPLNELLLFRSLLSPKGARYEVVERFPLTPR